MGWRFVIVEVCEGGGFWWTVWCLQLPEMLVVGVIVASSLSPAVPGRGHADDSG